MNRWGLGQEASGAHAVEIKHLHEELGFTILYVTHDQGEALTMSHRVVVLNLARSQQVGRPDELYDRPRNKFVADFIGETNLLEGKVEKRKARSSASRLAGGLDVQACSQTS